MVPRGNTMSSSYAKTRKAKPVLTGNSWNTYYFFHTSYT